MSLHQTFLHYTPPGVLDSVNIVQPQAATSTAAAVASTTPAGGAIIAKGDWTKDLVHLAKTAELKKHALTLQLHTAHILSAHASLEQKSKAIQDLLEQRNRLESERTRLLTCLREVNEDRDKVELMEAQLQKECNDTRAKIDQLTSGDYAFAKADVDRLRAELGQPPMPSLQETLDERRSQYLTERRLNGNPTQMTNPVITSANTTVATGTTTTTTVTPGTVAGKRPIPTVSTGVVGGGDVTDVQIHKRQRGRPKGSKNKSKNSNPDGATVTGAEMAT